jgi:hypothetical protein
MTPINSPIARLVNGGMAAQRAPNDGRFRPGQSMLHAALDRSQKDLLAGKGIPAEA